VSAEDRLGDLLARWEQFQEKGQSVSAEELARDCPELLEPLRQQIQALQAMAAVLQDNTRHAAADPTGAGLTPHAGEGPASHPSLASYEILGELGRGGMGVVFKARQVRPDRPVALKKLLSGPHARPRDLARFRAEVEAVARLRHPHIVQVYEVGEDSGQPYFAMEFVDGASLDRVTGGRPQPPRAAAQLVETLARAVHAVHQQGIIHRDLKPANVLLSWEGGGAGPPSLDRCVPKITDFGLAKRMDAEEGPTVSGQILGTPCYMAPEQALGNSKLVGPAADIYSLGAILYHLLTGRPPFAGETEWDTISQVRNADPVAPRRLQPRVLADLETICLKCLRKEPGKRYASAEALAEDLRRFLAGEPIRARPVGGVERVVKWAKRRPAAAALLVVSALAVVALIVGALIHNARLSRALHEVETQAERGRQRLVRLHIAQGDRSLEEGDWSGALVWFAEALRLDRGRPSREEMHRIRIAAVLRQCPRLLQLWSHDGPVRHAELSSDGRYVLTASEDRTAQVWDVRTGGRRGPPLKHDAPVWHGSFGCDGQTVVTAGRDGTARVWALPRGALLFPPLRHDGPLTGAFFSPDGRSILTTAEDATAKVWDAATGARRAGPLRHKGAVRWGAFSPDGRLVATAGDDGTARLWDARTGNEVGGPLKHDGPVTHVAFHPDGGCLVTAGADHSARLWDVTAGRQRGAALKHRGAVVWASFSRDGRRVSTASADHTACVWDVSTGSLVATLRHKSGSTVAQFSPDGRWVVTASDDNTARVWDAASGEPVTPMLKHNGSVGVAAFTPDGRSVLTAGNGGAARLWSMGPGSDPLVLVAADPEQPAPGGQTEWSSPDGRWVVTAEGSHGARVRDAKTRKPLGPVLGHGSTVLYAAFSPAGDRLVTASDDNRARIWDPRTGELLTQPLEHHGTVRHAAFSPDGRLVATASDNKTARVWDAAGGEVLTPRLKFPGTARRVFFSADGARVNVAGPGRTVWAWDLRRDDRPDADLVGLAEVLSGTRVDPSRGLFLLEADVLRGAWERMRARCPEDFTPASR
jgi:eukaryotic-like serine/threonine-protein kinase